MLEYFNHRFFQALAAPPDLAGAVLIAATLLAQSAILGGPALLLFIWIVGKTNERRAAVSAGLSCALALAVAGAISSLYFHPRPFTDGLAPDRFAHAADSSFPSDHATLLFALAFSLLLARPPATPRAGLVAMALALAVAWSRVFLGVHYPLDVAGAALIGLVAAACFASVAGQRLASALTKFGERIYVRLLSAFLSRGPSR